MKLNRKLAVVSMLIITVTIGVAFTKPYKPAKRNLKVLPQNISDKALDKIMEDFEKDLGVKCDFCHVPVKGDSSKLDFASDDKPEKEISREMMRMTIDINNKYFQAKNAMIGDSLLAVTCNTCHKGDPHPEATH
jgi:hypothetical protein